MRNTHELTSPSYTKQESKYKYTDRSNGDKLLRARSDLEEVQSNYIDKKMMTAKDRFYTNQNFFASTEKISRTPKEEDSYALKTRPLLFDSHNSSSNNITNNTSLKIGDLSSVNRQTLSGYTNTQSSSLVKNMLKRSVGDTDRQDPDSLRGFHFDEEDRIKMAKVLKNEDSSINSKFGKTWSKEFYKDTSNSSLNSPSLNISDFKTMREGVYNYGKKLSELTSTIPSMPSTSKGTFFQNSEKKLSEGPLITETDSIPINTLKSMMEGIERKNEGIIQNYHEEQVLGGRRAPSKEGRSVPTTRPQSSEKRLEIPRQEQSNTKINLEIESKLRNENQTLRMEIMSLRDKMTKTEISNNNKGTALKESSTNSQETEIKKLTVDNIKLAKLWKQSESKAESRKKTVAKLYQILSEKDQEISLLKALSQGADNDMVLKDLDRSLKEIENLIEERILSALKLEASSTEKDESKDERFKKKEKEIFKLQKDLEEKDLKRRKVETYMQKEGAMIVRSDEERKNKQKEYLKLIENINSEEREIKERLAKLEKDLGTEVLGTQEQRHIDFAKSIIRMNQHSSNLLKNSLMYSYKENQDLKQEFNLNLKRNMELQQQCEDLQMQLNRIEANYQTNIRNIKEQTEDYFLKNSKRITQEQDKVLIEKNSTIKELQIRIEKLANEKDERDDHIEQLNLRLEQHESGSDIIEHIKKENSKLRMKILDEFTAIFQICNLEVSEYSPVDIDGCFELAKKVFISMAQQRNENADRCQELEQTLKLQEKKRVQLETTTNARVEREVKILRDQLEAAQIKEGAITNKSNAEKKLALEQLEKKDEAIRKKEEEIKKLTDHNSGLMKKIREQEVAILNMESQAQLSIYMEENNALREQLARMMEQAQELEKERKKIIIEKRDEIEELKEKKKEEMEGLKKEIRKQQMQLQEKERILNGLENTTQELKKEKKSIEIEFMHQLKQRQQEMEELKKYANTLRSDLAQKDEEIELLQRHIQENQLEKDMLESTKAKLQQSLEDSRNKSSLRLKNEREEHLENELHRLSSLLQQANNLAEERLRKMNDFELENEEFSIKEKSQIKAMKQMESDHLVEKNKFLRERQEREIALKNLENAKAEIEEKMIFDEKELKKLREKETLFDEIRSENELLRESIDELRKTLDNKEEQLGKTLEEIIGNETTKINFLKDIERLTLKLNEEEKKVQEGKEEKEKVQKNLKEIIKKHEAEIDTLREEREEYLGKFNEERLENENEIRRLQMKLKNQEAQIEELRSELVVVNEKWRLIEEGYKEKNKELRTTLTTREEEGKNLNKAKDSLESELKELKKREKDLLQETQFMKEILESNRKEMDLKAKDWEIKKQEFEELFSQKDEYISILKQEIDKKNESAKDHAVTLEKKIYESEKEKLEKYDQLQEVQEAYSGLTEKYKTLLAKTKEDHETKLKTEREKEAVRTNLEKMLNDTKTFYQKELEQKNSEIRDLNSQTSEQSRSLKGLEEQLSKEKENLNKLARDLQNSKEKEINLTEQLTSRDIDIREQSEKIEKLKQDNEVYLEENSELKVDLATMKDKISEKISKIQELNDLRIKERDQYLKEKEQQISDSKKMQAEKEKLQNNFASDLQRKNDQLSELSSKLQTVSEESNITKLNLERLQKELQDSKRNLSEVQRVKLALEDRINEQVAAVEEMERELREKTRMIEELSSKNELLLKNLDEKGKALDETKRKYDSQVRDCNKLSKQNTELKEGYMKTLKELEEEKEQMRSKLAQKIFDCSSLAKELEERRRIIEYLSAEKQEQADMIQELNEKVAKTTKEIDNMKQEMSEKMFDLMEDQKDHSDVKNEKSEIDIKILEDEIANLKKENKSLFENLKKEKQKTSDLSLKLKEASQENEKIHSELINCKLRLEEIDLSRTKKDLLSNQRESDRLIIEELEGRIDNLEKENKTIYDENVSLRNIEIERDNLLLESKRLKQSLEESVQEVTKVSRKNEQLRNEVSEIGTLKTILEKLIQSMVAKDNEKEKAAPLVLSPFEELSTLTPQFKEQMESWFDIVNSNLKRRAGRWEELNSNLKKQEIQILDLTNRMKRQEEELQKKDQMITELKDKAQFEIQAKDHLENSFSSMKDDFSGFFEQKDPAPKFVVGQSAMTKNLEKDLVSINEVGEEGEDNVNNVLHEQFKQVIDQLQLEIKDHEENEHKYNMQINVLKKELADTEEKNKKLVKERKEHAGLHEREHLKTNFMKFLESAAQKKNTEGEEYLKVLFSILGISEMDKDTLMNQLPGKLVDKKKKTFMSLIFKK